MRHIAVAAEDLEARTLLTTLDVTAIAPDLLSSETQVEFFGDTISLEEVADASGTAAYEILTSLMPRVPRHYRDDQA